MPTEQDIANALKNVKYPGYSRDIVSFGLLKEVAVGNGAVNVVLELSGGKPEVAEQLKTESERAIRSVPGVSKVFVQVRHHGAAAPTQQQNRLPGIKRIVAVASGKGGVGKSTASVNLACGLAHLGAAVGLLDCDIYGPSIPLMMGVNRKPTLTEEGKMVPLINYGVKIMSIG